MFAAAELADIPHIDMMRAAQDLRDGAADTDPGRRVLELMRCVAGGALETQSGVRICG
jgi:hypothetical protein